MDSTGTVNAQPKLQIQMPEKRDDEGYCRTFVLTDEDHTLGNALRYMIMKNPQVEMCGYSQPHPADNKINVRVQTKRTASGEGDITAVEALIEGVENLQKVCSHVKETLAEAFADEM